MRAQGACAVSFMFFLVRCSTTLCPPDAWKRKGRNHRGDWEPRGKGEPPIVKRKIHRDLLKGRSSYTLFPPLASLSDNKSLFERYGHAPVETGLTGPYTAIWLVRQAITRGTRARLSFRNPFHDLKITCRGFGLQFGYPSPPSGWVWTLYGIYDIITATWYHEAPFSSRAKPGTQQEDNSWIIYLKNIMKQHQRF